MTVGTYIAIALIAANCGLMLAMWREKKAVGTAHGGEAGASSDGLDTRNSQQSHSAAPENGPSR